jgi:demethylmenaquinone methyltransferase/2-methoxy-6-polyprenyl-1,4-benzoquinol methylase
MTARATFRITAEDLDIPDRKRKLNERLFVEVAPFYDRITRIMSLDRDRAWKRELISRLPGFERPVCLDVACGTGDLCGLLLGRYREPSIMGVDLSESMLAIARTRFAGTSATFRQGDMLRLPVADESVDVVTAGYALRNSPSLEAFLAEVFRVVKPGGVVAFLEFSRPDLRLQATVYTGLIKLWGGFWSIAFHGDPNVYGYIADSLRRFPARTELHAILRSKGFEMYWKRRRFFGMVENIVVRKPGAGRV